MESSKLNGSSTIETCFDIELNCIQMRCSLDRFCFIFSFLPSISFFLIFSCVLSLSTLFIYSILPIHPNSSVFLIFSLFGTLPNFLTCSYDLYCFLIFSFLLNFSNLSFFSSNPFYSAYIFCLSCLSFLLILSKFHSFWSFLSFFPSDPF